MKLDNKKFLMLTAAAAIVLPVSVVSAATTTIDATATFRQAISLTPVADMAFGQIEFASAPAGGDTAALNTDGTMAYAGNFTGAATGTPGNVQINTGTDGEMVEVSCDATATMTDGSGASIQVTGIGIETEDNTGGTTGTACAGTGTPSLTFNLDLGNVDNLILGGTLDGSTAVSFTGGSYSTANAGGDDIEVQVVYQ